MEKCRQASQNRNAVSEETHAPPEIWHRISRYWIRAAAMNLDDTTRTQAAEWFSAQRRGMMSADERVHFDQWRASDANAVALDSMGALWGELAGLKGVMTLPARQRRRFPLGLAASLLLVAVACALMLPSLNGRLFSSTLRTAIG